MNDEMVDNPDRSYAEVPTAHASRYLQQLCKHFSHKLTVSFDDTVGRIDFTRGECWLTARQEALVLSLAAPDAQQLERLQDVVARHLVRFAFREELGIEWKAADEARNDG